MQKKILNKLNKIEKRYKEIECLLIEKNIIYNQKYFQSLSKEHSKLYNLYNIFQKWKIIQNDLENTKTLLFDSEIEEIAKEEIAILTKKKKNLEKKLYTILLKEDPDNNRNCYIEIYAGTGGKEATLFANDLLRMYIKFSEIKSWKTEIINITYNENHGYKNATIKIIGFHAYGTLKFESGGHRVQRIPETESQGRVHTSTCTVAVFPERFEEELPEISLSNLKIDTFRASGAGGQHVNTTESAIRITHIPTGIVVECQDERSQHKNKSKALGVLRARIHAETIKNRKQKKSSDRKILLGSGDRSDRNRTYNFIQGRITDHRINYTIYRLHEILEGNLDLLVYPIQKKQIEENLLKE